MDSQTFVRAGQLVRDIFPGSSSVHRKLLRKVKPLLNQPSVHLAHRQVDLFYVGGMLLKKDREPVSLSEDHLFRCSGN
jgi:hypothetical protein